MLRTSLRNLGMALIGNALRFLSSNAQDFIEDPSIRSRWFLSVYS